MEAVQERSPSFHRRVSPRCGLAPDLDGLWQCFAPLVMQKKLDDVNTRVPPDGKTYFQRTGGYDHAVALPETVVGS